MKSDLKAVYWQCFAYDANLRVPENSKVDVADEFVHIKKCLILIKWSLTLLRPRFIPPS